VIAHHHHIVRVLDALGVTNTKTGQRLDANETMALAQQLEHVIAETIRWVYPGLIALELIPLQTGVHPGAETVAWFELNEIGYAKMIANYATDLPLVGQYAMKNTSPIKSCGDAFLYSTADLRAAAMLGVPLTSDLAKIAKEMIGRQIEKVLALGDTTLNLPGFVKNSNVTIIDGSTTLVGDWDAVGTDGGEILDDLNQIVEAVSVASDGVHNVTDIALPRTLMQYANTKRVAPTYSAETAMQAFRAAHPSIKIWSWNQLNTADAGNDGPRLIAYEKSPSNMAAVVPIEFQAQPPQPKSLHFEVPCEGRTGGTLVKRPLSMVYVDNLLD
jgi:hypothetical protein